ncbi:hypothetical protein lerEdw1_011965 [Lerista edwardsae]|nr:hypothetical protein lerEdw1_011965 [Lerista edwardsae]
MVSISLGTTPCDCASLHLRWQIWKKGRKALTPFCALQQSKTWHENDKKELADTSSNSSISSAPPSEASNASDISTITPETINPSIDTGTDSLISSISPSEASTASDIRTITSDTITPSIDTDSDSPTSSTIETGSDSPTSSPPASGASTASGTSTLTPDTVTPSIATGSDSPTSSPPASGASTASGTSTLMPDTITPSNVPGSDSPTFSTTVSKTTTSPDIRTSTQRTTTLTNIVTKSPSPVTPSTIRTTTVEVCYNGGYHDDVKCVCPGNFYGPRCEFSIEEALKVTVKTSMRILNFDYHAGYNDTNSAEYKTFSDIFTEQMAEVYKNVIGYSGVEIQELRSGSLIVEHNVLFDVESKNDKSAFHVHVQNAEDIVQKQLAGINTTQQNCSETFCIFVLEDPVIGSNFSFPIGNCRNVADLEFPEQYYPNTTTGTLRCLSRCSKDRPDFMNCNYGVCRLSTKGAWCRCNEENTKFWYSGDNCKTRFQISEIMLGLALAILFVIGVVMAVFLFRASRKKSRPGDQEEDVKGQSDGTKGCYDVYEESVWTPQEGLIIGNEAAAVSDGHQWPNNEAFRPSLEKVDYSKKLDFPLVLLNPQTCSES